MRFTSTAKRFLLFILFISVLVTLSFYLIFQQPKIASILYIIILSVAGIFILYVTITPLLNFLSERATYIMAVYIDASGKGLHIFSSFSVSRLKVGLTPVRSIQYYFLEAETGKSYYKVLFKHNMQPVAGHAGYTGFTSFDEDVLNGKELQQALQEFSSKTGWPLQPGTEVRAGEREDYKTSIAGRIFQIEKKEGLIDENYRVSCYDKDGALVWRKGI
jgi:hypothetical protein